MNWLCWLFGHRPAFGYSRVEGSGYMKINLMGKDGIGRLHASINSECERCGENYRVGYIHVPRVDDLGNRIEG
jgi:hypothetical protein